MKKHRLLQAALAAFILIAAFGVYRYMVVTKPVAEKNKAKKSVVHVGPIRSPCGTTTSPIPVLRRFMPERRSGSARRSAPHRRRAVALREGTSFRKGDLLVRLYDDDVRASLMAAGAVT